MEEFPFSIFPDLRVLNKTSAPGTSLSCVFAYVIDEQATCSEFSKQMS